jgi:hypothetical protein
LVVNCLSLPECGIGALHYWRVATEIELDPGPIRQWHGICLAARAARVYGFQPSTSLELRRERARVTLRERTCETRGAFPGRGKG